MSNGELTVYAVLCCGCNALLDAVSDKNPMHIDKKCGCGSVWFYTQEIKIRIKILTQKPHDKKPIFKWNGIEFF